MATPCLSIRVEIVECDGETLWPRPGRLFAAPAEHTFAALADAINAAFGRWDRGQMWFFERSKGPRVCGPVSWEHAVAWIGGIATEPPPPDATDADAVELGTLALGEQFLYVFDLAYEWAHLCTVGPEHIDPLQMAGWGAECPAGPWPYWGWGVIPDQYGRRTADIDNATPPGPDPQLSDLPPLRGRWGRAPR